MYKNVESPSEELRRDVRLRIGRALMKQDTEGVIHQLLRLGARNPHVNAWPTEDIAVLQVCNALLEPQGWFAKTDYETGAGLCFGDDSNPGTWTYFSHENFVPRPVVLDWNRLL